MGDIKVVANGNKIIVKPDNAGITITPNAVKIIVSAGGPQGIPGSGSVWGGIGGTLSNQTDLQAALDTKLETVATDATITGDGTSGDPLTVVDAGDGLPIGGTARQVLTKIDGTDFNAEWRGNWNIYAMNVEYTGVETTIASGTVLDCTIDGATIYRFINSTNNVNGYPTEDSFYSTFNNPTLSNLLATRG